MPSTANSSRVRAGSAYVELVADNTQYAAGLRQARQALAAFAKAAGAIRTGNLGTAIAASWTGAVAAIAQARLQLDKLLNRLADAGRRLAGFGDRLMLWAGAGMTALLGAARSFTEMGDRLDKASARTGASVEWLSRLDYAARLSGSSLEEVEAGVRMLARALSNARTATAGRPFFDIGLDPASLRRLPIERAFEAVLERLGRVRSEADRVRLAMELLGRGGTALLPLAGDLAGLSAEAERLGVTWTAEQARRAAALDDAWTRVKAVFRQTGIEIGSALAPLLLELAQAATAAGKRLAAFIRQNPALVRGIFALLAGGIAVGIALKGVGLALSGLALALRLPIALAGKLLGLLAGIGRLPALLAAVKPGLVGLAHVIAGLLPLAAGIALLATTLAGLKRAGIVAWDLADAGRQVAKRWHEARAAVSGVGTALLAALGMGDFAAALRLAADAAKATWNIMAQDAANIWDAAGANLQAWLGTAWSAIRKLWAQVRQIFPDLGDALATALSEGAALGYGAIRTTLLGARGLAEATFVRIGAYVRLVFLKAAAQVTAVAGALEFGFRKAYYWSKRALPGYDAEDYAADVAGARAEMMASRIAADARYRDALAEEKDNLDRVSTLRADLVGEGIAQMRQAMAAQMAAYRDRAARLNRELAAELERLDAEAAAHRRDSQQWLEERIAGRQERIDYLKGEIARQTAAMTEMGERLADQAAATPDWVPGIAEDVRKIAAATAGPTAETSGRATAARWGGLGVFAGTLRAAWLRAGSAFGTHAAEGIRRVFIQDAAGAISSAALSGGQLREAAAGLEAAAGRLRGNSGATAGAEGWRQVEGALRALLAESARQTRAFGSYASGVSRMLQFT